MYWCTVIFHITTNNSKIVSDINAHAVNARATTSFLGSWLLPSTALDMALQNTKHSACILSNPTGNGRTLRLHYAMKWCTSQLLKAWCNNYHNIYHLLPWDLTDSLNALHTEDKVRQTKNKQARFVGLVTETSKMQDSTQQLYKEHNVKEYALPRA